MKLKILHSIKFLATWLLIGFIFYNIATGIYNYLARYENDIIAGIVVVTFLTVLSVVLHLFNRNLQINKIINLISQKVEENHISTEFYDNTIFPAIMEMQKPFTLRKPTLENYFDKRTINQYLS